jgi:hypothetical protein
MPYALRYREELPESVKRELDDMVAFYNRMFGIAFNEDGTLKASALVIPQGSPVLDEEHWWRNGPWTFDDPSAGDPNVAGIRPPSIPGGTYNDYAPAGIEKAIIIQVDPDTSTVTLTGLKAPSPMRKRMILFRNGDSVYSVILKHANAGSQPQNQFSLPSSTDIELGPLQNAWLYYDMVIGAWTAAITTQKAGGFNVGGAGGSGDVVGPGSATDDNLATFDGATGKLIQDSGVGVASVVVGPASAVSGNVVTFDGTTGKLIQDGGTSLASLVSAMTVFTAIYETTSKSQYMALNSSPQIIVAAPDAGYRIGVLGWFFELAIDVNGGTAFSSGPTISLKHAGVVALPVAGQVVSNPPSGTRYQQFYMQPGSGVTLANNASAAAIALYVQSSADLTGGSLATVHLKVRVYYTIDSVLQ